MTGEPNTKKRIFDTATEMFSIYGFHNVSMRQIANAVGINQSSIYNHFESKDAILSEIFRRYEKVSKMYEADGTALMTLVGIEKPHDILWKTVIIYPPEDQTFLARAMTIANILYKSDERACKIMTGLMSVTSNVVKPLLLKMIEMNIIEPLDVERFVLLYTTFGYCSAVRYYENKKICTVDYLAGLELLFQLVKEK